MFLSGIWQWYDDGTAGRRLITKLQKSLVIFLDIYEGLRGHLTNLWTQRKPHHKLASQEEHRPYIRVRKHLQCITSWPPPCIFIILCLFPFLKFTGIWNPMACPLIRNHWITSTRHNCLRSKAVVMDDGIAYYSISVISSSGLSAQCASGWISIA